MRLASLGIEANVALASTLCAAEVDPYSLAITLAHVCADLGLRDPPVFIDYCVIYSTEKLYPHTDIPAGTVSVNVFTNAIEIRRCQQSQEHEPQLKIVQYVPGHLVYQNLCKVKIGEERVRLFKEMLGRTLEGGNLL